MYDALDEVCWGVHVAEVFELVLMEISLQDHSMKAAAGVLKQFVKAYTSKWWQLQGTPLMTAEAYMLQIYRIKGRSDKYRLMSQAGTPLWKDVGRFKEAEK
jgi:hypothetical protein